MRAIIISDTEAKTLLDRLSLAKFEAAHARPREGEHTTMTIGDAHRAFHYEVVRWLQEMGADLSR